MFSVFNPVLGTKSAGRNQISISRKLGISNKKDTFCVFFVWPDAVFRCSVYGKRQKQALMRNICCIRDGKKRLLCRLVVLCREPDRCAIKRKRMGFGCVLLWFFHLTSQRISCKKNRSFFEAWKAGVPDIFRQGLRLDARKYVDVFFTFGVNCYRMLLIFRPII